MGRDRTADAGEHVEGERPTDDPEGAAEALIASLRQRAESAEARVRMLAVQLEQSRTACAAAEEQAESLKRRNDRLQSDLQREREGNGAADAFARASEEHATELERAVTAHTVRLQQVRSELEAEVIAAAAELAREREAAAASNERAEALSAALQEIQPAFAEAISERDHLRAELIALRVPPVSSAPKSPAPAESARRGNDAILAGTYSITEADIRDDLGHPSRRDGSSRRRR